MTIGTSFFTVRRVFVVGLTAALFLVAGCDSGGSTMEDDDGNGESNTPPTATVDVQTETPVEVGEQVQLDGADSSDPDGDEVSYDWSLSLSGTDKSDLLSDPSAVDPTFTPNEAGDYDITLTVSDGETSATDDATVTAEAAPNAAPTAVIDVQTELPVDVGEQVQLDGAGSSDPDEDDLTYDWSLALDDTHKSDLLSDSTAVDPTFTPDAEGTYDVTLTVADGEATASDDTTVTAEATSNTNAPSRPIAFARDGDIYIVQTDGSVQAVTESDDTEMSPTWSPDGSRIAFAVQQDGNIYTVRPDGSDRQNVTADVEGKAERPDWSPEGNRIAFHRSAGAFVTEGVYTIKTDGTDLQAVKTEFFRAPAWSPDTSRIAMREGNDGILTVTTEGSDEQTVSAEGLRAAWSPDGSQIAFGTRDNETFIIASDGSGTAQKVADGFGPAWSPHSRIAVYSDRDGDNDLEDDNIYTIAPDGSDETQITDSDAEDLSPDWKPQE